MAKFRFNWLLVALVLLASVLRLVGFGKQPAGTYWDETAILIDAKAIAQSGKDMHGGSMWQLIFPSYGDYKMPVLIWMAAASVKLFGDTHFALRLPSLLAGIGTVLLAYFLARELWPKVKQISYWSAFIVAVAPWSIIFSHSAFEGHVAQFLLGLAALALLKTEKHWSYSVLAALLSALATYTYFSVRFVWPAVLVGMTAIILFKQVPAISKLTVKHVLSKVLIGTIIPLVLYALLLIPMIKSPLYAESNRFRLNADSILKSQDWPIVSNQWREIAGNTAIDREFFHRYWLMMQALLSNYSDNLSLEFLFFSGDPNLRHGTGHHGLFLWFWLPTLPIGLLISWRKSWIITLALVGWWMAALLPASVPENTPHALRSLNALLPLSLLLSVGAAAIWEWSKSAATRFAKILSLSLKISVVIVMAVTIFEFILYYTTTYQHVAYSSWQTGFAETMALVERHQQPGQVTLIEHGDDKFFLWKLARLDFQRVPEQMVEQQYLFRQIGTTYFGQIKPSDIKANSNTLTLTSEKKLLELTTTTNQKPITVAKISDAAGEYILASWP